MSEQTLPSPQSEETVPVVATGLSIDAVQFRKILEAALLTTPEPLSLAEMKKLSDVPLEADIMNEEPFGPVALINPYRNADDMIAEANRLPYGLAAYAWTDDVKMQRRVARDVETGMLGINSTMIGGADSPFGGVKWSGHGHEDGPEGLMACLVLKAVHEG